MANLKLRPDQLERAEAERAQRLDRNDPRSSMADGMREEAADTCLAMALFLLETVRTISLWSMPKAEKKAIYLDKVRRARAELDHLIEYIEAA